MVEDNITYRIDKERWVRVCEKYPDNTPILVRANDIDKKRVVPDTARDKAQQTTCRGFVRIRPKQEYDIKMQ